MTGLIISGMHHSGTSVVARLLADQGWNPGPSLLPNDPVTGKSFYEDSGFVDFNRDWLSHGDPELDDPSDWGMRQGRAVPARSSAHAIKAARDYCAERQHSAANWFAKDPRSSLTLDVWGKVPSLRFLIIYRNPWDVVESLMRYGHPFTGRPDWALSVWKAYNERLLKSLSGLGPRAMVVSASAVLSRPQEFVERFSAWTGVPAGEFDPRSKIDPALFRERPQGSHISRVFQILHPEVSPLLHQLDELAVLPRDHLPQEASVVVPGGGSKKKRAIQVVIPCRNDGQFLTESISSVEETAGSVNVPVELTLVDGASDDPATIEYFRLLRAAGYQVIRVKKLGPSAARNAGLKKSRAGVVIPLDADNQLLAPIMTGALKVLDGEADVVFGPWQRFGLDNRVVHPPGKIDWSSFVPQNTVDVCAPTSRKLLRRLRGWDEDIVGLEDWDLWIRAFAKHARFLRVDDTLFEYCVRPGSMLWEFSERPHHGLAVTRQVVNRHIGRLGKKRVDVSEWVEVYSKRQL